jgi:hypothetical protein
MRGSLDTAAGQEIMGLVEVEHPVGSPQHRLLAERHHHEALGGSTAGAERVVG